MNIFVQRDIDAEVLGSDQPEDIPGLVTEAGTPNELCVLKSSWKSSVSPS